jgi:3-phosphoshikimate 1-carboxyvinyltransferase
MAALADGLTTIRRPLMARETAIMIEACRSLGAMVSLSDGALSVHGIGSKCDRNPDSQRRAGFSYIWAGGSALVARIFLTIGSALPENVIVDGRCDLRVRPFEPLTAELRAKGVAFRFLDIPDHLPCAAVSAALPGGHYRLGTDVSSQFITALLVSAPLAAAPVSIELTGPKYSLSYIRQTIEMMTHFGVAVETDKDMRRFLVSNDQEYHSRDVDLTGDYTSASYVLGAAFITRGTIKLSNLDPNSLQGEKAIIDILIELGARVSWIQGEGALAIDCSSEPSPVDTTFDLSDCPNILPTVAVLAATVPGRVRIVGGRLTQNHKSPRIEAVASEFSKAAVSAQVIEDENGFVDGLDIRGRSHYESGVTFSNHGDHRIAMAMMLFSLACSGSCEFEEPADTADSFPGFVNYLGLRGQCSPVEPLEPSTAPSADVRS